MCINILFYSLLYVFITIFFKPTTNTIYYKYQIAILDYERMQIIFQSKKIKKKPNVKKKYHFITNYIFKK